MSENIPQVVTPPGGRSAALDALKALDAATPPPPAKAETSAETPPTSPDAEAPPTVETTAEETPAEAVETTEVKATPEQELKVKLRARNAEIARREAELKRQADEVNQHRTRLEAERKALDEQAEKFRRSTLDLGRMAREEPTKFLELTGIPLNDLVKARMAEGKPEAVAERALLELEELKSQFRAQQEAAERQAHEQRVKAQNEALENEFKSEVFKLGDGSLAAKMMKRNPKLAMENAYAVSRQLHQENGGRAPTMDQLAARLEKEIRAALEDEAEASSPATAAPAPVKKVTPKSAAKAPPPKKQIHEMTEKERKQEALAELLRMEKNAG